MSDTKVQVSIVTYNNGSSISRCISSVLSQREINESDICILDNRSIDDTTKVIRKEFPGVNLVESRRNIGFGPAHNTIMRQRAAPYILVLNPDAEISDDLLTILISALEEDDSMAIAAPRAEYPDGFPQVSFGDFPPNAFDAEQAKKVKAAQNRKEWIRAELNSQLRTPFKPGWVSGSCMMLRRAAVEAVGYFDPAYFLYMEDVDLCHRLALKGWSCGIFPQAVCIHQEGGSGEPVAAVKEHFRKSKLRYINKFLGQPCYSAYSLLRYPSAFFSYDPSLRIKKDR